ncbi:hypothetical protein ACLB2K_031646 [Fragaria x ananassa]
MKSEAWKVSFRKLEHNNISGELVSLIYCLSLAMLALVMQGKHAEAVVELSKICTTKQQFLTHSTNSPYSCSYIV